MVSWEQVEHMPLEQVVDEVIKRHTSIHASWSIPPRSKQLSTAHLVTADTLLCQISLSKSLHRWLNMQSTEPGDLLLAWTNIGLLVEGTMKWFLSVFHEEVRHEWENQVIKFQDHYSQESFLYMMRKFFHQRIWFGKGDFDRWVMHVHECRFYGLSEHQQLQSRMERFDEAVRVYLHFLRFHQELVEQQFIHRGEESTR
ncbi:hypothetical protein [Brevibacillus laterosporus]|uniref:hypothetical protein n=1 Tax=Brevibacillus laterosporus TaxID=1465 RepID=UPI00264D3B39|nr:hypothetical protein [Brevibacillus laterosporus]MDN9009495.1 hypothetical protein [Brevibacillus laterosporus]MDO0940506.1 hypothetical protein [Brevibacillus laterosporus]